MKKSVKSTIGIAILLVGIILLGADRIFVSADSSGYGQSMTAITIIALIFFLVGAIWFFKSVFD